MINRLSCILVIFCFLLNSLSSVAQDLNYESSQTGNPLIPGYFADPSIVQMDGKFYIYATTVSDYFEPVVWASEDLKNWEVHHLGITSEHRFWAPSMLKGDDGKYYLYHSSGFDFKCHLYIGETPIGPFKKFGKVEEGFDMQIFKDPNNNKVYGISSNPQSRPRLVEFNSDSRSEGYLKKVVREIGEVKGTFFDYTEGSMLLYRDGWYYMFYSGGKCGDVTYNIRVARSRNVEGPYEDAPNNPILKWDPLKEIYGPGHNSVLELNGEYFIFYHRQEKWAAPTCQQRQVCADKMVFNEEGWIERIEPTHSGVDFSAYPNQKENRLKNLAFQKPVTASGNQNEHEPSDAIDENYGTYWDGGGRGNITLDLGAIYTVEQIRPFFVYYDYFNLFKIEYSNDNINWNMYADRTSTAQKAWLSIPEKTVKARYIKLSVVRGEGPAAALFELEVWGR